MDDLFANIDAEFGKIEEEVSETLVNNRKMTSNRINTPQKSEGHVFSERWSGLKILRLSHESARLNQLGKTHHFIKLHHLQCHHQKGKKPIDAYFSVGVVSRVIRQDGSKISFLLTNFNAVRLGRITDLVMPAMQDPKRSNYVCQSDRTLNTDAIYAVTEDLRIKMGLVLCIVYPNIFNRSNSQEIGLLLSKKTAIILGESEELTRCSAKTQAGRQCKNAARKPAMGRALCYTHCNYDAAKKKKKASGNNAGTVVMQQTVDPLDFQSTRLRRKSLRDIRETKKSKVIRPDIFLNTKQPTTPDNQGRLNPISKRGQEEVKKLQTFEQQHADALMGTFIKQNTKMDRGKRKSPFIANLPQSKLQKTLESRKINSLDQKHRINSIKTLNKMPSVKKTRSLDLTNIDLSSDLIQQFIGKGHQQREAAVRAGIRKDAEDYNRVMDQMGDIMVDETQKTVCMSCDCIVKGRELKKCREAGHKISKMTFRVTWWECQDCLVIKKISFPESTVISHGECSKCGSKKVKRVAKALYKAKKLTQGVHDQKIHSHKFVANKN
ncbi:hypothetical protein PCE1_004006 [Barthelona sp. PCE]